MLVYQRVNLGNHILSVVLTVNQHVSSTFDGSYPMGGHETVCFRGIFHSWCRFALEELPSK